MTGERSSAKAAWLGACWGLGHTLTLLTTGALLVALQTEMPAIAAQVFEVCVVLLLVGFGVRAIYQGACRVPAGPTHSHRRPGAFSFFQVDRWTFARPLSGGRGTWTGGQRRDDCTRGDGAAVNGDTVGLFDAIWCGIDRGDGGALGAPRLADRTPGSPSLVCAHRFTGRRVRLDRARLGLGLSVLRRLVLASLR